MSEIVKVSQRMGDVGRPKEVQVLGGNRKEAGDPEILGAKTVGDGPRIIDRTTKTVNIEEKK